MDVMSTALCGEMPSCGGKRGEIALHLVPGAIEGRRCCLRKIGHLVGMGFSRSQYDARQRAEAVYWVDLRQTAGKVHPLGMSFRWTPCCHREDGLHQFVLVIPARRQCPGKAAALLRVRTIDKDQ